MYSPIAESSSDSLEDHIVPVESSPVDSFKRHERRDGEPVVWFARFQDYLLQGRSRSVRAAYRHELHMRSPEGGRRRQTAPQSATCGVPESWRIAVRRWDWFARAASYDLAVLEQEKQQIEADRDERRRLLIEQEWKHGNQMVEVASEALRHGHKFFERNVKSVRGKMEEREEIDPKTGQRVIVRTRVDREIVYLELKANDINRFLVDGGKKMRLSVGLTTDKAQADFEAIQTTPEVDSASVDAEIYAMFEALGANKPVPQTPE